MPGHYHNRKKSESWRNLTWWFRLSFFGVVSRRAQFWVELFLYFLGLIAIFTLDNKFAVAGLFAAAYSTGWSIRYGDRKNIRRRGHNYIYCLINI